MISKYADCIDINYSLQVTEALRKFESNKELGFRTTGSEAEKKAANYLYNEFQEIGLKNVRKEKVTVDTFEFKTAEIRYNHTDGKERRVVMSSYQARCLASNEPIEIVYIGKGRDVDYDGIDVEGKFVLVDIDMLEEWWINWPLCQAKIKKAKGIIAVNVAGYCSYAEDCLGVQDICAPADMPAFSISVADSRPLKEAIALNGGSLKARLTADVKVENDGYTYDIIGEIPGKIDEVIYLIGHYDAYFRAFDDNSAGIGCILGIVRALIKSGYSPRRTLRVVCHGGEEWAIEDSRYDWARGANMLTWNHPEWKENGFLLVNIDGNTINSTATAVQVRTSYEMAEDIEKIGKSIEGCLHEFKTNSPIWTWTESYMYNLLGIPSVETFYEGVNFWGSYHSNYDLKEVNSYTDEEYRSSHLLYGSLLQRFDELEIRPLKLENMFKKLLESADECADQEKAALKAAATEAIAVSRRLSAMTADGLSEDTLLAFNRHMSRVCEFITKTLFGIDWNEEYDFIHVHHSHNVKHLASAVEALKKGDIGKALDEDIISIDLAWYGYNFDYETYRLVVEQTLRKDAAKTWATGKLTSQADLWEVSRSLISKREEAAPEVEAEIRSLEQELNTQKAQLSEVVKNEIHDVKELIKMIDEAYRIISK